jgi:ribosomal protein S14
MKKLMNECVICGDEWNVLEHLGIDDLNLDDVDTENIRKHGRLYCRCEDCGYNNESVCRH